MNYAIVPFAFVMFLSTGYFVIWGRKWFKGPVRVVDGEEVIVEEDDNVIPVKQ